MGYSTDSQGRLCCDSCGKAGGVRRRRCPVNYCPAWCACAECWNDPEKRAAWNQHHVDADCRGSHERFQAERAAVAELQDAGEYVFSASVYADSTHETVKCWFSGASGDSKVLTVSKSLREKLTRLSTYDEVFSASHIMFVGVTV